MIVLLLKFLSQTAHLKVPAAFYYSSTRMILAAITALLFTIIFGPRFIKKLYELKTGQSIRVEDCPVLAELHQKKKETPTMGGILILSSLIVSLFLWMDLTSVFTWTLLLTTVWLGLVGGADDYLKLKYKNSKGLSGKKKLLFQILLGALIAYMMLWSGIRDFYAEQYYIPFWKEPIFIPGILGFLITIFVITGSSNAVNLTDGLDGLAAGCLVMVSLVLGAVAFLSNHIEMARYLNILYIEGSGEIAIYMLAMVGACLGFLWFNGYPAQVFMGDVGSLALGGIVGVTSVLLRREVLFAIAGGIFVAEAVSVILQVLSYKYRNRKRVFLCAPLHHHFEYKGWAETKVVLRFWIVGLLLAFIALSSLKLQ